ncbi:hypothetical protein [Rhizobium phage RHph_X2_26]|nr:hypothetical protein [Rhizobium phage RHph_X2_26]
MAWGNPPPDMSLSPQSCFHCGFLDCGVAYRVGNKWQPYRYACDGCAPLIEEFKEVRRLEDLERKALAGGVEKVAKYLDTHLQGVTDLAEMEEFDAEMIVKMAWEGCAERLRQLVREGDYI